MPLITESDCEDEALVKKWFDGLVTELNSDDANVTEYNFESFSSSDDNFGAKVTVSIHGLESSNVFRARILFFRRL